MTAPALGEHLPTQLAHELKGHEGAVLNVRFNTQGTYCLTCGKVRPWDQRQQPHLQQEAPTQQTVRCSAINSSTPDYGHRQTDPNVTSIFQGTSQS